MEPGEGSAAPKATVALPGTDVNPAGRAPARLAVHCNLATGGPGAAMRHAPFGRPRHPLGTFPCGKVPRPPAGGRNLPQETGFLWEARKRALLSFFCFSRDFASAEATRGLSARPLDPFGAHPYMRGQNLPRETNFLRKAGKGSTFLFPVSQRVSPLRRRPKGFPVALWKPSALCCAWGIPQKTDSLWQAGKEPSLLFPYHKRFRLCGGHQGVFRSPSGPLRGSVR